MADTPLSSQQHRFDIPGDVAYLHCACLSPTPRHVLQAGGAAGSSLAHPWDVETRQFFEAPELLRGEFTRPGSAPTADC